MNINSIVSTTERLKILRNIIYKTELLSVNKVANELQLSKGLISKYFNLLAHEKIVKRKKAKYSIQSNINAKLLRILLTISSVDPTIFKKYSFVKAAGIYGSSGKGTNTESSDIDLWVFVEKTKDEDLANVTHELKRRNNNINPLYLTKEKLALLRKEDTVFYHSLVFGSITLCGEDLETI